MLKKTIKYTDFDGETREEDFYFNLTKAELAQMRYSVSGGLEKRLTRIINSNNQPELIKIFCELIDLSYGIKSDDGRKFMKNASILEDFKSTEAYSQLFMQLASDEKFAEEFINGVLPSDLVTTEKDSKKK